jgi:tetratricopeptide (TPR) repeat protein
VSADAPTAFLSYSRDDSVFALQLAKDLKAAGAAVWIDQLDIQPGMQWDRAVEDALSSCPRMLVILSPASVKSDNVHDEVSFALSKQKRIIPVLYRECDVPFRLARLQHIDFRTDCDCGLEALLRTLGIDQPLQPVAGASGNMLEAIAHGWHCPNCGWAFELEEFQNNACKKCSAVRLITSLAGVAKFSPPVLQRYVTQYDKLLKSKPEHREALLGIGICYQRLGLFDFANRFLDRFVDAYPADAGGYYYKAIALFKGRRPRIVTLSAVREARQRASQPSPGGSSSRLLHFKWTFGARAEPFQVVTQHWGQGVGPPGGRAGIDVA